MPRVSAEARAAADRLLAAHCRSLIAAGVYPSVAAIKGCVAGCPGLPRNNVDILASRRRCIAAGLLELEVDARRAWSRTPGRGARVIPRRARAIPDPVGFVKPLIAAMDPPAPARRREPPPCWKEVRAYTDARAELLEWVATRPEATCPI